MAKKTRPARQRGPLFTSALLLVAACVALFGIMAAAVSPERIDLSVGEVSSRTITATKDVEDAYGTKLLQDAAIRAVQPSYVADNTVQSAVLALLKDSFDRALRLKDELGDIPPGSELTVSEMERAEKAVYPCEVDDASLAVLLTADMDTVKKLADDCYSLVRETLIGKLPEGQEDEAVQKIRRDLLSQGYDEALVNVAGAIVANTILPNMLLDEETTEFNRQRALEEVEPVIYKKGQNVVRAGEVVTAGQIQMLDSLGMLKDKSVDLNLYGGLLLLLLLLMGVIALYLQVFAPQLLRDNRTVSLLSLILVLTTGLCFVFRTLSTHLMPVALGAMLTTLLIKPRLAILVNLVLAILTGLMTSGDNALFSSSIFSTLLISLISGSICVCVIRQKPGRLNLITAGLVVSATNVLTTLAAALMNSASQDLTLPLSLWGVGSGLLSAVLCIGLQPALEWLFNLVTPSKLMELSNPNQPLLRRLLLEAPGTYHHSIIVANLAEAAAAAVGANGLLARVGAYYHDIGKLKRPLYFKENQLHDNPHDRTDPRVSTAILTAHPRDGVEMAQKARLPEPVQEIIAQHHGDTPVLFFYDKAVKQNAQANLDDFRYDGPRPRSREAAIVMLADTIEAAARAMSESTPEKLGQMIRRLVRSKMEDGQLDDCSLTFADLNRVCEAFMTVLIGVYHERVEYPKVVIPERPIEPLENTNMSREEARQIEAARRAEEAARARGEEIGSGAKEAGEAAPEAEKPEEAPAEAREPEDAREAEKTDEQPD